MRMWNIMLLAKIQEAVLIEASLNLILVLIRSAQAPEESLQARRIWVLRAGNKTLLTNHQWWTLSPLVFLDLLLIKHWQDEVSWVHSLARSADFVKILHACLSYKEREMRELSLLQPGNFLSSLTALHTHNSSSFRWCQVAGPWFASKCRVAG